MTNRIELIEIEHGAFKARIRDLAGDESLVHTKLMKILGKSNAKLAKEERKRLWREIGGE